MKYVSLFLITMACNAIVFGQNLTDAGNSWTITRVNWESETGNTFQIKIDNDTLINTHIYKTLLSADDAYNPLWQRVHFYLREDNDKIVYILDSLGQEGILYHFGLEQGQQVELWNDVMVTVLSIDSVMVANGQHQKRFHIKASFGPTDSDCSSYTDWIAGIGNTGGPLPFDYNCMNQNISYGLGCFFREETSLIWPTESSWCEGFATATTQIVESATKIYPNPVTDAVTIHFDNQSKHLKKILLFNSQGQFVFQKITFDKNYQLEMAHLPNGIFFLQVIAEGLPNITKKLVKI